MSISTIASSKPVAWFALYTTTIFLILSSHIALGQEVNKIRLPGGTVVAVSMEQAVDSDMTSGAVINFRVIRDVTIDDKILIQSGSMATGVISEASSSGAVGSGGKVAIALRSVRAVDGQEVFLRGTLDKKGDDKVALSVILGLICLPLFLLNGDDAQIPAGTEIRAYTEQDYSIVAP